MSSPDAPHHLGAPTETSDGLWWAPEPPDERLAAPVWAPGPISPETDVLATRQALRVQQEGASLGGKHGNAAGPLRAFVRRHGWRAYALPVLIVITVVALTTTTNQGEHKSPAAAQSSSVAVASSPAAPSVSVPPTATGDQALKTDDPAAGSNNDVLKSAALPSGGAYTVKGTGRFNIIPGTGPVVGHVANGNLRRYTIEVEGGITGIDLNGFAATVQSVLSDQRSWIGATTQGAGTAAGTDPVALQRIDSGYADFRVTLVSSMTVRTLCGYDIPIETSCFARAGQYASTLNRVVLNDSRWIRGDAAYIGDLLAYRNYMINHETGHALGHEHAHVCLSGGVAPVMLQQTIGLKTTSGQICTANPWPYPTGVTDAPGVEAPDNPGNNEFNLQNE